MPNKTIEIERKFMISAFPTELELLFSAVVEQGYLSTSPEVRIRSCVGDGEDSCRLTVKGEGDLVRKEVEVELTREQFESLRELLDRPLIRKDFRVYRLGDCKLECSCVDPGTPDSFMYAEVEFDSESAAERFVPPDYLTEEVTYKSEYRMKSYWLGQFPTKHS